MATTSASAMRTGSPPVAVTILGGHGHQAADGDQGDEREGGGDAFVLGHARHQHQDQRHSLVGSTRFRNWSP